MVTQRSTVLRSILALSPHHLSHVILLLLIVVLSGIPPFPVFATDLGSSVSALYSPPISIHCVPDYEKKQARSILPF
ncbi:hypothetical protein IW261DRAFT_1431203 [Armillaria novae-zelandiae]|uniref:Uncharacterized protein n=1 Tax=Armillaria novae-zelandiae TaxID=153914 RepID=A0AA39UI31_9AGAR|nr:hypothetical protein IW261DRAFT_1431203 [Armillaria novae-zelandiae]